MFKKLILAGSLAVALPFGFIACGDDDDDADGVGDTIEEGADDLGDAADDGADDLGDAADDGADDLGDEADDLTDDDDTP